MVFGKGYDESLWLILQSDRKNRREIIDFVNSIPEEMFIQMYKSIDLVKGYIKGNVSFNYRSYLGLNGFIETSNYILYWYCVDPYNGTLTLGYSVYDGKNYDEAFEMSISLFDCSNLYASERIGTVEKDKRINKSGGVTGEFFTYALVKSDFGFRMVCETNNKKVSRNININKLFDGSCLLDIKKLNNRNSLCLKKSMNVGM